MTVRAQHTRPTPGDTFGPIETTGDVMAGKALQVDLLDGIVVAIDLAMDNGVGRGLRRHGPEPGGDQQLAPHALAPLGPGLG